MVEMSIGAVVWIVVDELEDDFDVVVDVFAAVVDGFAVVVGAQVTWWASDRRARAAIAS